MALLSADLLRISSTRIHPPSQPLTHIHTHSEQTKKRNARAVKVFNVTTASDYELKSHQKNCVCVCLCASNLNVCVVYFIFFAAFWPSGSRSLSQFAGDRLGRYFHFRLGAPCTSFRFSVRVFRARVLCVYMLSQSSKVIQANFTENIATTIL